MDNVVMIRLMAALVFFVILLPLYFLPTLISRRKRNATAIFWLNLLAGWTFIGWIAALIWANHERHPRCGRGSAAADTASTVLLHVRQVFDRWIAVLF